MLKCYSGKGGHTSDKVKLSQAKRTSVPTQVKPFAGKVFYLDLPSNRVAETLESDIKQLGGVRHYLVTFTGSNLHFVTLLLY